MEVFLIKGDVVDSREVHGDFFACSKKERVVEKMANACLRDSSSGIHGNGRNSSPMDKKLLRGSSAAKPSYGQTGLEMGPFRGTLVSTA
jgi:hypothetical protein